MNINGYELDNYQMDAIMDNSKSVLVVAGAGSGKSLTILGKVKYLIEEKNYKENEILCISFTNESTKSLYNKLLSMGYNIDTKTFHKLSLDILNNDIVNIINDNYLDYIIDEYFNSFIKYNKKYFTSYKKLSTLYDLSKIKSIVSTFIHLAKSNGYTLNNIYKFYKYSLFSNRKILKYILDIYLIYRRELESTKSYDFDDLISEATKKVKYKNIPYKYIIIDEFQDTSLLRYNLIKEIVNKNNASIFVVGDDYQSIYRFSGCNLNIFTNFNKYFDNTSIHYLKYTYRNSQELINVSANFIMKNKHQLRKSIESNKHINKPIKIVFNKNVTEVIKLINSKDILIIGRNNKDISNIDFLNKLTIHKSKGLEADQVILVNSDNIPSRVKNEELLRHVTNGDYILHEEERRLFYVALTRTKNNIYIMVNKKMSPFVKELIHDYSNYIEIIS